MMPSAPGKPMAGLNLEEKRELLKRLLLKRTQGAAGDYPLSYGQRALWFLHQLAPGMSAYNIAVPACAAPSLDPGAFQRAFNQVLIRHEALRCVVRAGDGELLHEIRGDTVPVQFVDLRGSSPADIHQRVVSDHRRPFNLDRDLPIRASVYQTDQYDVVLATAHHLAFDAWSAGIFLEDLRHAYAAQTGQSGLGPTPATAAYRDFVLWQKQMLTREGGRQGEYWSRRLSGELPVLRFPYPKTRPASNSFSGGAIAVAVESSVLDRLRLLAKEQRTTLFSLLLAAWGIYLALLCGDEEIMVGVPVSGRTQPEWATVIGYFVNALPIRLTVNRQENFRVHLHQASERMQEALANQDFPFSLMVERLKIFRHSQISPVFQTMLNVYRAPARSDIALLFQPGAERAVSFGPSRLGPYPVPQQEGQFDLVLELLEGAETLVGHIKFSNDATDSTFATLIRDQFLTFLREAMRHPDRSVASIGREVESGTADSPDDRDEFVL